MSLLERLFGLEERARVSVTNPRDPVLAEWFGGASNTSAGVSVTPDRAMRLSAVFACVRILSSSIASLPLSLYSRDSDGSRRIADMHPLHDVLHTRPNRWQTSFEWREMMQSHLLLRGNAYSLIVSTGAGVIKELIPLHPDRVTPAWAPDGKITYAYRDESNTQHIYLQNEILHIRGMSFDGLKGLSPIEYMRETVGLTLAAEQFGSTYFGNGTVIGGVLEHPNKLGEEAYKRLKDSWADRHQGGVNAHKPAILEEGMKWQALGVPPEQAQFLETRKFQVGEIARIFGVPPHMIGDVEKTTSWGSGIESQGIGFVVYSLRPWLVRWEQCFKRDLLDTAAGARLFVEYNVEGLLRGDSAARAQLYREMFNIGVYSQNDIRRKENENPIQGGDTYYVPLNMTGTGQNAAGANEDARHLEAMHAAAFRSAADRVVNCEVKALERALNGAGDDLTRFEARAAEFYAGHENYVRHVLGPLAGAAGKRIAKAHITESLQQLHASLTAPDPRAAIDALLEQWRVGRAEQIVRSETHAALEGVKSGY